jgi:hypothetical protein
MLNVRTTSGLQQTAAGVMIGILASFPNSTAYESTEAIPAPQFLYGGGGYSIAGVESTKASVNAKTISIGDPVVAFQQELAEVFEDFYKFQKPLDDEFAKVLSDNLWDLYIR